MKYELKRLNIELSARCSYACAGCPNTYMKRKKGNMSFESFKQIYGEIEDKIQKVYLWNYGEPLLNPHIAEIICYTKNKKPRTVLSTTGQTLPMREDLSFLSTLDELIISINGFDSETYSFHQKGGNFTKIVAGLRRLKPIMERMGTEYILQTVANSRNINQIDEIEQFAREYGFNKVVLKSFNVMDNKEETERQYVPQELLFSRKNPVYKTDKVYPCFEWMVVNWNGDVNICCWDYEGEIIVGNVLEQGVFDVWESKKMTGLKQRLANERILPYCSRCTIKTTISELVLK
ncbi:MAG: radical SAM protein [Nanoarchaeota archaeon]|nr:radical SAM protein [Nanoarchaeota archaeon]MBU1320903.1 radical SAM protein [Nanoarchaeota archaeon]MBU1597572.1 radical SAM protein [Nanoarchaeota archaeon]MBU2441513.1 radical SAM protein [Nanoarchaeota archaeon]